jgi:methyltransferase (TIGR00027 family)
MRRGAMARRNAGWRDAARCDGAGRCQVSSAAGLRSAERSLAGLRGSVQIPAGVRFVPVEFGADDPATKLAENGFASGRPTLVLWEGVTNYLDPVSVDATFRFLASAIAPGSPVLFTYVDRAMLDGSAVFEGAATTLRAVHRVGEPFTFGLHPTDVPGYLTERGFELVADTVVRDAAERFYPAGGCPSAPAYYHLVESRRA